MSNNKPKLELTWIGKGEQPKLEPRILIEDPTKSYGDKNAENMLIYGDNLLALKALEQDYTGKIKCVYIDPPFNTRQAFENYNDSLEHSIWLNLMSQRLQLIHKLLCNDGVLWIHLDDSEVHYCKVLLDEIFGRNNFIIQINYERSGSAGLGQGGTFVDTTEYLLLYNKRDLNINEILNYSDLDLEVMKRYNRILSDEGDISLLSEFLSKSNGKPVRLYLHTNYKIESISLKDFTNREDEIRKIYLNQFERIFRTTNPQAENEFQNDLIEKMGDGLYSVEYTPSRGRDKDKLVRKYYNKGEIFAWLRDSAVIEESQVMKTNKLTNIWTHSQIPKADLANEGGVKFPRGKKPEQLLKRIIEISTTEDDFVLDSFVGSGSTAAVAHKMKRKWIGIELGEHCNTHALPRLKTVINGTDQSGISKSANWKGGSGFKYYYLAPSLLNKDSRGNWIINKEYNAVQLAAAMARQEGFRFSPDETYYWRQGKSTEKDYIFTTTNFVSVELVDTIHGEMKEDESLLICCTSFSKAADKYPNITIKKIPKMLLGRCEFGKDDYSLNIINMPKESDEPDFIPTGPIASNKPKEKKKKEDNTEDLFSSTKGGKQ